jgi:hypothetical protein
VGSEGLPRESCCEPVAFEVLDVTTEPDDHLAPLCVNPKQRPCSLADVLDVGGGDAEPFDQELPSAGELHI